MRPGDRGAAMSETAGRLDCFAAFRFAARRWVRVRMVATTREITQRHCQALFGDQRGKRGLTVSCRSGRPSILARG